MRLSGAMRDVSAEVELSLLSREVLRLSATACLMVLMMIIPGDDALFDEAFATYFQTDFQTDNAIYKCVFASLPKGEWTHGIAGRSRRLLMIYVLSTTLPTPRPSWWWNMGMRCRLFCRILRACAAGRYLRAPR